MNTKYKINLLVVFGIITLLISCTPTTQITKSWSDPSVNSGNLKPFNKVLIIARLKDQTSQHIAEDKLASHLKQGVGVQSYSYLSAYDTIESVIEDRMKKDGFDGLLTMRLTNVSQSMNIQNYGGGGYYGRGYGYGYGYGYGNTSTTVSVDHTYFVETSIYQFPTYKLIWSGTTSTLDPSSLNATLDEIIAACKADMAAKGIIAQPTR